MSSIKTVATFAIIIGCFAVLYPRFLHPMMLRICGLQTKSSDDVSDTPPGRNTRSGIRPEDRLPPHMGHQGGDHRQHMRPGPHPGMRAAAEMQRQQTQHGGGRGMMGIVLPMYAVGIVLYLVYTLVKVFGKKDKELESGGSWGCLTETQAAYSNPLSQTPLDPLKTQDFNSIISKDKKKELENLLLKADDKSISEAEMKELQRRLEETESQMTQILKAMRLVQNKVVDHTQVHHPVHGTTSWWGWVEIIQTKARGGKINKSEKDQETPDESKAGASGADGVDNVRMEEAGHCHTTHKTEEDKKQAHCEGEDSRQGKDGDTEEDNGKEDESKEFEENKEEEDVILQSREETDEKNVRHRQVSQPQAQ
ncbi:resistance to inhibitors of cholinesterase protein 3-like [Haliotis rubra]|uniref:resistance to inhibitors of cholinesterase protein 3-like n=1 Tax=Haliotis rubra TaxID=36100 RepID=UPI001EE6095A|nr:resistance to inhibitors of cholinesterase protein 3-like [Haliotis rubra]